MSIQSKNLTGAQFYYCDDKPYIKLGDQRYELGQEVFDSMLTLLKIPTKYMHRFAAEDAELASKNVNLWLEKKRDEIIIGFQNNEVSYISESAYPFISSSDVISATADYLGCKSPFIREEDGLYIVLFRVNIPEVELESGESGFISIRLTYSESFSVAPRVDAVLTVNGSFESYYYPIQRRNFKVANMGQTQVINQIAEFSDMVLEQMHKQFIPALNKMIQYDARLNIYGFVERLCAELRLSKKLCVPLLNGIDETEVGLHNLVRMISNNLLPEARVDGLDYLTAREIEIALSRAIVSGRFK